MTWFAHIRKSLGQGCQMLYIFKPNIPIWVNFGGPWNGKVWYIIFHLEYVTAIWYI
jgi:hypothetical protein